MEIIYNVLYIVPQNNFKTVYPTNTFGFSHTIVYILCTVFTIYTKATNNIITLTIQ